MFNLELRVEDASQSNSVGSGSCQQHLGLRKGMAIASRNVNGLRSHLYGFNCF